MVHPPVPAILPGAVEITERALDCLGRVFAAEVAQAVGLPLLWILGDVGAIQEPEGTLVYGALAWTLASHEHAVAIVLEQLHAGGEVAGQAGADGRLGERGLGEVVERRQVGRGVGLVDAGGRHGGACAADGTRTRRAGT